MISIDNIQVSDDPDVCNIVGIAAPCLVDDEGSQVSTFAGPTLLKGLAEHATNRMRNGKPIYACAEHGERIGIITRGSVDEQNRLRLWLTLDGKTPASKDTAARARAAYKEGKKMGLSLGLGNDFQPVFDEHGLMADVRKSSVTFNECSVVDVPNLPGCYIETVASDKIPGNSPVRYLPPASTGKKEEMSSPIDSTNANNKNEPVKPEESKPSTSTGGADPAAAAAPASDPNDWAAKLEAMEKRMAAMEKEKQEAEIRALEQSKAAETYKQDLARKEHEVKVNEARSKFGSRLEEGFKNAAALADLMESEQDKQAHIATAAGYKLFMEKPEMLLDERAVQQLETQLSQTNSVYSLVNRYKDQNSMHAQQQQQSPMESAAAMSISTEASGKGKPARHTDQEAALQETRKRILEQHKREKEAREAKEFMERQRQSSATMNPFNFPYDHSAARSSSSSSSSAPARVEEPEVEMVPVYRANNIFALPMMEDAPNRSLDDLERLRNEGFLTMETVASDKVRDVQPEDRMTVARRWAREVHKKYGVRRKEDAMLTRTEIQEWRNNRPKDIRMSQRTYKMKPKALNLKRYGTASSEMRQHNLVFFDPTKASMVQE